MTGLPTGWAEADFTEIAEILDSRRVPLNGPERAKRKGNYPYYGANGLVDHIDGYLFEGPHVLLAEDGGHFFEPERGVAYTVDGRFWVNNHAHILKPAGEMDTRFLCAWLNATDWVPYVGGSTRAKLTQTGLGQPRVGVPPPAEQRRIVEKLDALTARTALARADLDRIPALAAHYEHAVLRMAFSGELTADWRTAGSPLEPVLPRGELDIRAKYRIDGAHTDFTPPYEVPGAWRWLRLPELGVMDRGKSRHRPRDDARLFGGPFPFVQTGEVRAAHRCLTSYSKTYSAFGLEQSKLWPAGTVCITIAANIAETAILGIDACFPDSVVGFSADPTRCLPDYVEYFIRTAKADLEQFAPATAQKNINLEVLGSVRLPVAPLDEQAEIVRRIDHALSEITRMTSEAAAARRLLDRLDQAVLAKAFRGELVPQDPAEEPASVLLDGIRAKRASAPKSKRGRKPVNA